MPFLRKYATATHIHIPIIKRGVVDFALGADWTPAAGDVKVSIDGGAAANIGTLPSAVAMGNGAYWDFTIASGEATGKKIIVTVADSATKAVEDQSFSIETYGHASAEYVSDLSAANTPQTGDSYGVVNSVTFGNSALKTLIDTVDDFVDTEVAAIKAKTDQLTFTVANQIDSNVIDWKGSAAPAMTGDAFARLGVPTGASVSADVAAVAAKTTNLPSDPADASDIAASFSTVNSTLATIAAYIDTEVAAIKAKTDNLPSDPADASDVAASFSSLASTLATIAGYIDTEVAAIKAKTDNLPAAPAATGDCITAAGVRTAVGLASANLDAQLDALPTNAELATALGTADDATLAAIAALSIPTANANAAALLDLANGVETGKTVRQALRLIAAALAGKRSNSGTSNEQYDAIGNPGTARIVGNLDAAGDGTPTLTP